MGRSLRIAFVTPRYLPCTGGIEQVVKQLATRIAAQGHRVEVLTQTDDGQLASREIVDGVLVRRFAVPLPSRHFAIAPTLWRFMLGHDARYDVLHAHNYHALPALGSTLCRRSALVFSPHYHGAGHSPFRQVLHRPYRLAGGWILRRAGRVICVSEAEAALVRRHFPYATPRVQVIPLAVEAAAIRAAVPFPTTQTVVLSAGRLERYKQTHRLIEAMAYLEGRFVLRIVGDGPERAALEALSAQLQLTHRVAFSGRVDDHTLHRWYRTAATYASLSRHEAFGMATIEALAAGARVIASDIPAFREQAQAAGHGRMTLVSPDVSAPALALAIRATVQPWLSPSTLPPWIAPAWDTVVEHTLCVYRDLVG